MMFPKRLELQGLGPFETLDLKLGPRRKKKEAADLHLFTGQNGTGKTTLLRVMAVFFAPEEKQLRREISMRRRTGVTDWYAALSVGDYQIVACEPEGSARPKRLKKLEDAHPLLDTDDLRLRGFGLPRGHREHMREVSRRKQFHRERLEQRYPYAAFAYSGLRRLDSVRIQPVQELDDSPFDGALGFDIGDARQVLQWVQNAEYKAAWFDKRDQPDRARDVQAALRRIEVAIGEIIDNDVAFVVEIDPIEVRFRIGGDTVSLDVLPDGLKSILSWLADLIMRLDRIPWAENRPLTEQPFILMLDEVDVHLHPAWQRRILPVVQKLFPNAQIFATTHSPFMVGSVGSGWIYQFDLRPDGKAYLKKQFEALPGQSVDWILEEIFEVPEQFDLETERMFRQLRELRQQVLESRGKQKKAEWHSLIKQLKQISVEVRSIAATEERQVNRLLREAAKRESLPPGAL